MTEQETAKINRELDEVISDGNEFAITWLRDAFHTHKSQIEDLLLKLKELREFYLRKTRHKLSVREAQLLNVCRICRGKYSCSFGNSFILDYGEEFAHELCLKNEC